MQETIIKSPLILQKEKELKELQAKKKKIITALNKQKTTLEELKEGVENFGRTTGNKGFFLQAEIKALQKEFLDLLKQAKKSKKIPKKDKLGLNDLIEQMEMANSMLFGDDDEDEIDMEELARLKAKEATDEWDRSERRKNLFDEYKASISKEEQGDVRKLYIKLANQFHPDKAKNEKEAELFHEMMQKINAANEAGDYGTLLALQERYAEYDSSAFDTSDGSVLLDLLDQSILKIKKEVQGIDSQVTRIKEEIKNIKKSDLGKIHVQEQRDIKRHGIGGMEEQMIAMEEHATRLRDMNEGMKEYIKTGVMPEILMQQLMPEEEDNSPFGWADEDDDDGMFQMPDLTQREMEELLNQLMNMGGNGKKQKRK